MSRSTYIGVSLALLLSITVTAQVQTPQTVSVAGTVINISNNEPISNVTLIFNPRAQPGGGAQRLTATSDSAGKFTLPAVVPGLYSIQPQRVGFIVPRRYGLLPEVNVPVSQTIKDLKIQLTPTSVISGRVLDENGEPKSRALVQLMEPVYRDGRRMLAPGRGPGATTDERGEYRLANVEAGEYYIRALPASDAPTFAPSYYPGVPHPADAARITVNAGRDLSAIDIQLARGKLFTVRFKVRSALPLPANTPIFFFLAPQDRGDLHLTAFNTPFDAVGDDTYVTPRLPPGQYVVRMAYGSPGNALVTANLDLNITDRDEDLGTVVVPAGRSVNVRIGNAGVLPSGAAQQITVRAAPIDGPPVFTSARLGADGTGRISRNSPEPFQYVLPEGRYRVDVTGVPPGYSVSSAKFNGTEVLDHGLLIEGEPQGPLELTIVSGSATVSGVVRNSKDEPAGNSRVVLIPSPTRRGPMTNFPTVVTNAAGAFTMADVPPGEYGALAFDYIGSEASDRFYSDPEFLKAFDRQVQRLTVERGSASTVNLRLIPISKN